MSLTYRMDLPTLVLAFRDNHRAAITIPAGEIVELIGPAEIDGFVVVSVNDEKFRILARDLVDRGHRLSCARRRKDSPT
jgi:hypothetical protein